MKTSLAHRSVTSAMWNTAVSWIMVAILFVRTVILARLLPVDVFGVYAFAGSVVTLSLVVANFGMVGAFLHRAPETEDEEQAAAIHFTLKALFVLAWALVLAVVAFLFTGGPTRTALLVLTAAAGGQQLAQTPRLILMRRVQHRRLALLHLLDVGVSTLVAIGLAWRGGTLWALLATDLVTLTLFIVGFYLVRPVWRPRLAWSSRDVRYFLRFGSRSFVADLLLQGLDRVDDLWTGIFLGDTALGLYSRAYAFATYPRRVLAMPLNAVAGGTYAELKEDRKRLSQAFFRTNAFLVRSGFFLAGLLALLAPEFIRLMLGSKWLPMLQAFRLMLVFTLLDPINVTVSNLFVAVGEPGLVARARLLQMVVLMAGLFLLGPAWGIVGVALAVDLMLVVGIAVLLWQARPYVDYSLTRLFAVPGLALAAGLLLAYGALLIPGMPGNDWRTAAAKILAFSAVYVLILFALEREQLSQQLRLVAKLLPLKREVSEELGKGTLV